MSYPKKFWRIKLNRGMTYVEFIVVLSIMGTMSAVVLSGYQTFQKRIEIKNLANEIALKIVQSQKDATAGKTSPRADFSGGARPSYGTYFKYDDANKKSFIYFVDLDNNGYYGGSSEEIDKLNIANNNYISGLKINGTDIAYSSELAITFTRPNSGAKIKGGGTSDGNSAEITVSSSGDVPVTSTVTVYSTGRIKIN